MIEKGIKLTDQRVPRTLKYPFNEMDIGDSFRVDSFIDSKRVRAASHIWRQTNGVDKKFAVRRETGNSITYRCWRIA